MKSLIANAMLLFCSGWILYHLIMIKAYGSILIAESDSTVLAVEIFLMVLSMLFALARLFKDFKDV
jgi:hypothetical protein